MLHLGGYSAYKVLKSALFVGEGGTALACHALNVLMLMYLLLH